MQKYDNAVFRYEGTNNTMDYRRMLYLNLNCVVMD